MSGEIRFTLSCKAVCILNHSYVCGLISEFRLTDAVAQSEWRTGCISTATSNTIIAIVCYINEKGQRKRLFQYKVKPV